jgi:NAD(P)-dependent dehydrogenase (short-subunit alcohol dehydrogenase family)
VEGCAQEDAKGSHCKESNESWSINRESGVSRRRHARRRTCDCRRARPRGCDSLRHRAQQPSRPVRGHRPETIEETSELIAAARGVEIALRVDHLESEQVRDLVQRIDRDHGRLDVLVNDIWGGDTYLQFNTKLWEHDLAGGLRMLRLGIDTHAITSHHALPLLIHRPGGLVIEMTDGTAEYNAAYRHQVGLFYDLVKNAVQRMALAQSHELAPHQGAAVAVTPGWLRSEKMLDAYGVTEANWRDATARMPHFCISESPTYVGRAVAALAADPEVARWTGKVVSSGDSSPLSTGSPTSMVPSRTAGAISWRSKSAASPPTTPAIGDDNTPASRCTPQRRQSPRRKFNRRSYSNVRQVSGEIFVGWAEGLRGSVARTSRHKPFARVQADAAVVILLQRKFPLALCR